MMSVILARSELTYQPMQPHRKQQTHRKQQISKRSAGSEHASVQM